MRQDELIELREQLGRAGDHFLDTEGFAAAQPFMRAFHELAGRVGYPAEDPR